MVLPFAFIEIEGVLYNPVYWEKVSLEKQEISEDMTRFYVKVTLLGGSKVVLREFNEEEEAKSFYESLKNLLIMFEL